jgi:hypothetical protein
VKDIPAIKGRYYIHRLIEEGEHEHQDFKFAISDARKIARSISAFANNDGGRLLIGVKDNGVVAGIRNEEDIYMIETAAQTFCKPSVDVAFTAFKVDPGTVVIRAEIPKTLHPPVCVKEADGQLKAYYRVKDENILAPDVMLRSWYHYANSDGTLMRLTENHNAILSLLRSRGKVTIEDCERLTHLSHDATVDLLGRLIATSIVSISYDGAQFLITI